MLICPKCNAENIDGVNFCRECGADITQNKNSSQPQTNHIEKYESIGGWLILVAIGLILSPLMIAGQTFPMYSEIFSNGTWEAISTVSSETYNPALAFLIKLEMLINGVLFLIWIYMWFLFFSKKREFPMWFITISLFTLIFIIVDAVAISSVMSNEENFDADTAKQFFRSLISSMVWIPYMLISKRVKSTFVN